MTFKRVVLTAILCSAALARGEIPCKEYRGEASWQLPASLRPGMYQLVLVAKRGSRMGAESRGLMQLQPAIATDRSPRTGAQAIDEGEERVILYGWTDANLALVGAPLSRGGDPAPDSRDPVYPGVLVVVRDPFAEDPAQSRRAPTLMIGTPTNSRTSGHNAIRDGCGIELEVKAFRQNAFVGTWGGIWCRDGEGHFCIRAVQPAAR